MKIFFLLLMVLSVVFVTKIDAQEKGKLERFEDVLSDDEEEDDDSEGNSTYSSIDDEDGEGSGLLEILADTTFFNLFTGTIRLTGHILFNFGEDSTYSLNGYNEYPYSPGTIGIFSSHSTKRFYIQTNCSYFTENSSLTGYALSARLSPIPFINLSAEYISLSEQLPESDYSLDILKLYFEHNRVRTKYFNLWWGAGFNTITGRESYDGFSLSMGSNIYFGIPLSITGKGEVSFINKAKVYETYIGTNIHFNRFKFSIGLKNFQAGDVNISGLMTGLSVHF